MPTTEIALDTETTGLAVASGDDTCIGLSITFELGDTLYSHYYGIDHDTGVNIADDTFDMLASTLMEHQGLFIYANRQFDVLSLETIGIDLDDKEFIDICTMAHLINENKPSNKGVESLAQYYLKEEGKIKDKFVEAEKKSGNHNITPEQEFEYAAKDAESTFKIWKMLKTKRIWTHELPATIWPEKQKLIRTLTAMRRRGVKINTKLAQREYDKGRAEMDRILKELGYPNLGPKALTDLFLVKFKLPVVKRTPSGAPSFAKEAMEIYDTMLERTQAPEAKLVKEYRGWMKSTSASFKPYLDLLSTDGRLRPTYHTHRVTTGRLSCSEPNLQQISKDGGKPWNQYVKKCFIAEDGYVLLSADYSQLELRLATAYAQEMQLTEIFEEGRDLFTEMGQQLGMERGDAKRLTYALQYGAGVTRVMNLFGVSRSEATRIKDNFWHTYPRFAALNAGCAAKVVQTGKIRIWSGRYRHFEYSSESYKAMNSLIQGGAADLVERVMVRAFAELDNPDCQMLLQVHDALVFEVKRELADDYREKIKAIMEDIDGALPAEMQGAFPVKFNVEVENWSD